MSDLTDPTNATSLAVKRGAFVGFSAGAAALGGSIASALAAGEGFGAAHDPIVAESDPAIAATTLSLRYTYGGSARALAAYAAIPKNAVADTPGIVVVQQIWGLDAQLRDVVRRFAKEGYCSIAPDLYSGLGAPSGDGATDVGAFRPFAAKLEDDTVDHDVAQCAAWLRLTRPSATIGVTGFCMGGGITLRQTVDEKSVFAAAAMWYGKVRYGTTEGAGPITPIALAYADEIGIPLLGSFGGRDTSILADDVRALDGRLTELGRPHDIKIYDEAGHAFFDDTRRSFVASAAADSWTRTLTWFARYLRR